MLGVLIDVPLLVGTFVLMLLLRRRLAAFVGKVRLPRLVLYLLISIPLVIFEEDIDCQAAWCGRVVIPPTLPFLLIEMFALGAIATLLHARSARNVTLAFCIYGVFYELVLGGLRGIPLSGFAILIVPYVALDYAYVSLLPLTVLLEGKDGDSKPMMSADVSEARSPTGCWKPSFRVSRLT